MATLTRTRPLSTDILHSSHSLSLDIPKPFPTRAEREQTELLESLALEDLQLDEVAGSSAGPSTRVVEDTRSREEELLPSIINLQTSCLTTLNDLLSSSSQRRDDHRTITPSTSNQTQLSEGADDPTLLHELQLRVDHVAPTLSLRDAELAHALLSLLTHFHGLSSSYSSPARPGPSRTVSAWSYANPPEAMSGSTSPLTHLRRHLSDFQLERHSLGEAGRSVESRTPILAVQTALLWTQIDEQLETVLSLCRFSSDDTNSAHLPPQYDSVDYEHYEAEGLPQYEAGDYESINSRTKSLDKGSGPVSPIMSHASTSEKMRMDFEAVTQAIDRLYEVAPQLHNQRVELKTAKLEQMERARKQGKSRQVDGEMNDERELEKMLELLGKAASRKMSGQAVVVNDAMKARMEKAKERERDKRAAFVEQLVRHSGAGRLDSQDAVFSISPGSRSASAIKMEDPNALLTLPEFIREAVPVAISQRMQVGELDPEALLSLPDFMKEVMPQRVVRPPRHSRFQSVSVAHETNPSAFGDASGLSRPLSKSGKPKSSRSRSLSAPPLAWLLSNTTSRASSPAKTPKMTRPGSSHGRLPSLEAGLGVTYVAEHHENLQHILVFLTVVGVKPGSNVEAEVLSSDTLDERPRLILRSDSNTSLALELPARVTPGKKEIRVVGDQHYEIKLYTPSSSRSQSRPGTPSPPTDVESAAIMDAIHLTSAHPTSFICASCSLPLVQASRVTSYRDLPSEHWAELVDAWMCHGDMKLHEDVKKGSKDGFWPGGGEALVGGSYVLVREDIVVKGNLCEPQQDDKHFDDWTRARCICGAVVGRCQEHATEDGTSVWVYRFTKYAFRPVSPTAEPIRVPLSAFIVEDMNEFVQAHATYRFVIVDEEEDRPRILIWLFKPNMRLSYTTPSQYSILKSGSIRAAKTLFKVIGPAASPSELPSILNKYPGFPQAEHIYYPIDICRRIAGVLKESNKAYPESMRTMTGLDVGWLQRA